MIQTAIKRSGERVPFDIQKIRTQVDFATEGRNISGIDFESQLNFHTRSTIKTQDIQYEIISTAVNNINADEPDWTHVAGRSAMYDLYRGIFKQIKIDAHDWIEVIEYLVRNGYYRKDVMDFLNKAIQEQPEAIQKINEIFHIERLKGKNYDWNMTYPQVEILKTKYLIKNKRGPVEYPVISDIANALILSRGDMYFFDIFDMIHNQYISLATPFKRNLRRPNGNVGSCFIGEMPDNLAGIMKSYTDIGMISKEGGGVGWYLGKVRPEETYTYSVTKANNITKWVKIANDVVVAVNQGGSRPGALTLALDWWHLDIDEFLHIKSELNGDLRDKAFDIFPQMVVDTWFIDAVLEDREVFLFNQYDYQKITGVDVTEKVDQELQDIHKEVEILIRQGKLKHYKKIKAKDLWKKALWTWIEIGDFYITHKDKLNTSNYLKYDPDGGIAKCANLCVESFSLSKEPTIVKEEIKNGKRSTTESNGMYHSCNLLSINAANLTKTSDRFFKKVCKMAVLMLDRSIDEGTMPVKEAENASQNLRNIGIGLVGLADLMAWNKVMYDTKEGQDFAEKFVEKMAWFTHNASVDLAKETSPYPLFKRENHHKILGFFPGTLSDMSPNGYDWEEMHKRIQEYGIRNFYLMAFAPNSSTGILQNAVASYLPVYNKSMYQTLSDMSVPILPKFIKERYWNYKTKFQYHPKDIIRFTSRLQTWVDTGMSMEININPEICKINEISDAILNEFKNGSLKTVYYSLTIDGQKSDACSDCAN